MPKYIGTYIDGADYEERFNRLSYTCPGCLHCMELPSFLATTPGTMTTRWSQTWDVKEGLQEALTYDD